MAEPEKLELKRVVFYGRSLAEYELFFNLDRQELVGKTILDCPAGTASFAAELRPLGAEVWSVDLAYARPARDWRRLASEDIEHTLEEVRRIQHVYSWDFYPDWSAMRQARYAILDRFLADWDQVRGRARHIAAALPRLPFADRQFDLVLSGHLLFIYQDYFPADFQLQSLLELVRVSRGEVRVFPVSLMNRQPVPGLSSLREELLARGVSSRLERSRHEFARGWNTLLILRRG